jgi:hypothetical protein
MKASNAPIAIATLLASALLLAACGKGQDQQPAPGAAPAADAGPAAQPSAPAAPAADAAAAPITKDSPIWFEPASISACPGTAPVVGVVHWNASRFPNVTTVQLTMPAGEGKPDGMFTVSANVGQKETGPWLAAGTEFVLRDNASGTELARAKMPAEPCAQQ